MSAAERVGDTEARSLLFMRYLNGLEFSKIAEVMDCSVSRVYKLHRKALLSCMKETRRDLHPEDPA